MNVPQKPLELTSKYCLNLSVAKAIACAAEAEAIRNNWKVSIAIVDDGTNLVYLQRLDGAHIASAEISQGKAKTAMRYGRPSKAMEDAINGGRFALAAVDNNTPLQGAVPIIYHGEIIGAIGISGVLPTQDEQIAMVGASVLANS
jgi:uncharacterized protein GlcG (DUF336 family)